MNEYTFYQDHKGTIWQRSHFSVNAESLNEAKQIIAANNLSSNFVGDLDDGQTIVFHKSEYLYDTLSSMVPDHNQGHATIIVLDSNHETICMNGHDPQVDRSVRKELRSSPGLTNYCPAMLPTKRFSRHGRMGPYQPRKMKGRCPK